MLTDNYNRVKVFFEFKIEERLVAVEKGKVMHTETCKQQFEIRVDFGS